jgi:D-glycero-alpha-D-manno-heptose-7-phosphate kinase
MLIARTPVRISFGGGGTDLPAYYETYGGAVLSVAINKYFYTLISRRTDSLIQVISSDLKVTETWEDIRGVDVESSNLGIVLTALKSIGRQFGADIFLASEVPPGTGLGSSAAVSVNVLTAICAYLEIPISRDELAERAYHVAHDLLAKPVGKQDEYAAAFGGLNHIIFHPNGHVDVNPVRVNADVIERLQANLMLFNTGASHDSWHILKQQDADTRQPSSRSAQILHQVKQYAATMRAALERGDLQSFAALLDEAWQRKKQVASGISNDRIDHLYNLAIQSGARGGKITGAGGGGFLLLYCEPANQAALRAAFAAQGIREMKFAFDFGGSQTLVNDRFLEVNGSAAALHRAWSR